MRHDLNDQPPVIIVSAAEQDRLLELALALRTRMPKVAEVLLTEMDRATVVEEDAMPGDVIRMGSTLVYRDDEGTEREVTLVYPDQADIKLGRVSIATPIGAALIGLSQGQSIRWVAPNGKDHRLTILKVMNAQSA